MVKNLPANARTTCCRAAEPRCHNYGSPHALESLLPSERSHHSEKLVPHTYRGPRSLQLEKAPAQRQTGAAKKQTVDLFLLSCSVVSDSFATPWAEAHQVPLSMGFTRQKYWSGLPFPSPGDLPNPGI